MSSETTQELIKRYTALLNEANRSYYHNNTSIISDDAFNELYQTLAELEEKHPQYICADSPIRNVASDLTDQVSPKVAYSVPMLSIATKTDAGITPAEDFIAKVYKLLPGERVQFIAEPKYDGLAINARYTDSKLTSLSTRGNKVLGENITYNQHLIQQLPCTLPVLIPGILDVRGEVVVPTALLGAVAKTVFEAMNQTYATPRHMAAALARSKTQLPHTLVKPLVFFVYGVGQSDHFHPSTQLEVLQTLSNWGFDCFHPGVLPLTQDPQVLFAFKERLMQQRPHLGYEIDGVVYKVNSLAQQKALGVSGKEPRWAIAHKFPPAAKLSQVLDIQYQVGKTGALTPVVYIEPIDLAGVCVHKLNAHNLFELRRKRIKVGSTVMVELAGDVIPQITMTLPSTQYLPNPKVPKSCPSCGKPVLRTHGATKHQCTNTVDCPAQVVGKIAHFTSRACANIEALGEKTVQDLVEHCQVRHPYDLFTLSPQALRKDLPHYTQAKITRIIQGIADLNRLPAEKIIQGLSIPGLGERAAAAFCQSVADPASLATLSAQELACIDGLDTPTIAQITTHFSCPELLEKYRLLLMRLNDPS